MGSFKPRRLTDEEREQRRAADRQYAQQAVEQLRSSAGWQQWLQTRAASRTYSPIISGESRPT